MNLFLVFEKQINAQEEQLKTTQEGTSIKEQDQEGSLREIEQKQAELEKMKVQFFFVDSFEDLPTNDFGVNARSGPCCGYVIIYLALL